MPWRTCLLFWVDGGGSDGGGGSGIGGRAAVRCHGGGGDGGAGGNVGDGGGGDGDRSVGVDSGGGDRHGNLTIRGMGWQYVQNGNTKNVLLLGLTLPTRYRTLPTKNTCPFCIN